MEKTLPIDGLQKMNRTMQINDLLSDKGYYQWFYENYINISICGTYDFSINYTDDVDYHFILLSQNIADYKIYTQDDIKSSEVLNEILRKMILKGYYNQIWVDEFYIGISNFFNKYHFVHPIMIYGFHDCENNNNVILDCRMFHQEKGTILFQIELEELYNSIKSAAEYYMSGDPFGEAVVHTIKSYIYKKPCGLPFDLNTFRLNFEGYLFSKPSDINRRILYPGNHEVAYGLKVYDVLIDIFNNIHILNKT